VAVYAIIEITIHDPETYAKYVEAVRPIVERHGGRYLARGGEVTTIAGGWKPQRLILIGFESKEDYYRCFQSDEYRAVAPFRERATDSRVIVVEGCD
jgi:uncharacterized protein (DUF1330 family)